MPYYHESVPAAWRAVHISEIRTFNSCRVRWYLSSVKGMRPAHSQAHFWIGTGIHESIRMFHTQHADSIRGCYQQWLDTQADEMKRNPYLKKHDEYITQCVHMLDSYQAWYAKEMKASLSFGQFEVEFRVPLVEPSGRMLQDVCLGGRVDALAEYDGKPWLVEFKTTSNMQQFTDSLARDNQCRSYYYAMRWFEPICGVLYILIDKRSLICRAVPVQFSAMEMERFTADLCSVALNMTDKNVGIWPSPSEFNCNWCPYASPCDVRSAGLDYQYVLDNDYVHTEPRLVDVDA